MASGRDYPNSIIASVADYDENAKEEVDDSRKIANSAAKRTSQQMTPAPPGSDLASDSGYSSRTQATATSADSVASVNLKTTKAANAKVADSNSNSQAPTGPSRRRATESGASDAQQSQNSNTAPTSTKKKRRVVVQCKDPDCPECVVAREREQRGRKPTRRVTISTNPTPEKSPAKKAKSDTQPSRPSHPTSRPAPYPVQGQGIRRPSASAGPPPKSMYDISAKMMAGGPPHAMYNSRSTYPAPGYPHPGTVAIIERPGVGNRTISARQAHPVSIHARPNGLVQYNPNGVSQLSARRTLRPSVVQSDSESEEELEPRQPQRKQQVALRQRPVQAIESESESEDDEEDSEEEEEDDEDDEEAALFAEAERRRKLHLQQKANAPAELQRRIAAAEARNLAERQQQAQLMQQQRRALEQQQQSMPPPVMPASMALSNGPKLSMRKANPAPQITYGGRRPSMHDNDEALRGAFRDLSVGTSSARRPSLASSGGTKATSYSHPNATGNARVIVEGTRGRRLSYVCAENHAGLAAMHAQFNQPQRATPDFETIIANAVRQQMDRLQLSPTQTAHSRMDLDDRMQEVLRYQQGIDANASHTRDTLGDHPQVPLTADALRRKQNNPSHTGSTRSSEEGNSRISAGHRLTAGSDNGAVTVTGDEMKVRIDTSNGFEMEFEGRKVTLLPAGDGTAELIIGGKRETTYFSTRGSTINGSRIGGSKIGRTPTAREPTRERDYTREPVRDFARDPVREYAREPAREFAREPAREFAREPARESMREPARESMREPTRPARDPRERDPRDREPRDRDAERVRERAQVRRDREDRRHQARDWKQADFTDYESGTEYDEPPRRVRGGGRPRAETYDSEHTERAAPVRRPPPPSPRYSSRNDRDDRDDRDDRYDDYAPKRRSRQEAPYAPGPTYNGRGPKGPPSAVDFGA